MSTEYSRQDSFLNDLCSQCVPVAIYLVNGIRVQGEIAAFDRFVVTLRDDPVRVIYKHAIASIVPGKARSS